MAVTRNTITLASILASTITILNNNITLVHAATTTRAEWVPTSTGITVEEAWDQANDYYEDAIEAVDPKDTYKNAIGFDAFDKQIETDIKSGATLDQINTKVSASVSKTEALIPGFEGVADKQMSRLEVEYKVKSGALKEDSPDAQVLKQPSVKDSATTPWPMSVNTPTSSSFVKVSPAPSSAIQLCASVAGVVASVVVMGAVC
ncbi:hypothetical protein Poli38472_010870 [Pythium oligandrum]|uniref:Uncharacterized protein n=1 Tax=Pythium oligandrum TaxID=41045 RepID=A0A8K1CEG4_PYTOL|nr:hypothetical protein Poli38472_010870 [Pythium oligandrum]|eukprot:TMW61807.1 hypothetical protein Poli38472_010870 [Pythium oligandrum]